MDTIKLKLKREQAINLLRSLPFTLSGRTVDPTNGVRSVMTALGIHALSLIRESFLEKSRGGTDEAGDTWTPLKPETIAYGRRHPDKPTNPPSKRRPLLTAAQDRQWRAVFVSAWRQLDPSMTQGGEAEGWAAARAWIVVKAAGGRTMLQEYGSRDVEIGRDTGRMFNSLSEGAPGTISDQVFNIQPGYVEVGTNVEYAKYFHAKRPLWPSPERIPQSWIDSLGQVLQDGFQAVLKRFLQQVA